MVIWAEVDGVRREACHAVAAGDVLPEGVAAGSENDVFDRGTLPNTDTCGKGNIPSSGKILYKIRDKTQKQHGLKACNRFWFRLLLCYWQQD